MPAQSEAVVAIFKSENSIQCEAESGVSALTLRRELENLDIAVFDYKRLPDGMAHPAVCGAPTGFVHVFNPDFPLELVARANKMLKMCAKKQKFCGGVAHSTLT